MKHRLGTFSAVLAMGLIGTGQAQINEKTTVHKCGNYTVTLQPLNNPDFRQAKLTLKGPRGVVFTVTDWMVDMPWCKDITGDGIPEVDLQAFSGGAHCCFTHHVYTLTNPPRKILEVGTAHTDSLEPSQLDGKGPLELTTADWRFAYGYGMSFAESVALPEIYSYVNGQYVINTRAFPSAISKWFSEIKKVEDAYSVLAKTSEFLILGKEKELQGMLSRAPADLRDWIEGYLPELREDLSNYGYTDQPVMAGIRREDILYSTLVGPFVGKGGKQVLSLLQGSPQNRYVKTGQVGVVLLEKTGTTFKVTPMGLTVPRTGKDEYDYGFSLVQGVLRSNGISDVVTSDVRSGSEKLQALRVSKGKLVPVQNDALATALQMVQDLYNVAKINQKVFDKDAKRTAEQWEALQERADILRGRAKQWTPLLGTTPEAVSDFVWSSLKFLKDTPREAQIYLTVGYGNLDAGEEAYSFYGPRYGLTLTLQKDQHWRVVSADFTRLKASPYDEDE